jgi:hypothetical protein
MKKHARLLILAAALCAFAASGALSAQDAVAAPTSTAQEAAPGATSAIRILTYNLGLLRAFGTDYVPTVDARAKAAGPEIARFTADDSPGIMLFEEVWYASQSDAIMRELSPQGYTFASPGVRGILGLGSGLLLAVKDPLRIVEWTFTPFRKNPFMERFARKGVLEAVIEDQSDGTQFALVGTHTVALDTVNGEPKDKSQVADHTDQVSQILAAVEARSQNGQVPVLLLGDFNVGPGYADASYRLIASADGLREAGESLTVEAIITWDPENPLVKYGRYPMEPAAKLDHIFLNDGGALRWTPREARRVFDTPADDLSITPVKGAGPVPTPLSDHYGFMVDVELGP